MHPQSLVLRARQVPESSTSSAFTTSNDFCQIERTTFLNGCKPRCFKWFPITIYKCYILASLFSPCSHKKQQAHESGPMPQDSRVYSLSCQTASGKSSKLSLFQRNSYAAYLFPFLCLNFNVTLSSKGVSAEEPPT